MINAESMEQLANRFFSAIENVDLKALDAIYTADAVVWHNYDNVEQPRDANIAMLSKFPTMFRSFKYANIRRAFFDGGFVQQHVVRGVKANGDAFAVPTLELLRRLTSYAPARIDLPRGESFTTDVGGGPPGRGSVR